CGSCGKACANGEVCAAGMCSGCAAGRYEGPATATAVGVNVSGTISFTLGAPMGDQYPVTKGTLSMTGANMASAQATVTGTLDCTKKKFTGTLTNGTATLPPFPPLPFTGTLTADYMGGPPAFSNGMITAMGG